MQMALVRIMMRLAAIAILIHLVKAERYIVGAPNGGWDLNTPLQAWANLNSFVVGDSLTFVYTPPHDVVEVSKTDYDTCLASNPIQLYSGGNSVISLSSPGDRYFICGVPSHCDLGMKVSISTVSPPPPPALAPPPQTPPSSAASPPTATGSTSPPSTSSGGSPISPTGSGSGSGSASSPATSSGGSPISPTGSGSASSPTTSSGGSPAASITTPHVSPAGSASSPATNSGGSPSISPSNSIIGSPINISPSVSPSKSPATSVASPPAGLAAESPLLAPFPSVSSPSSQPSSADKVNGITGFITMGFGFAIMFLLLPL